jgi:CHAD domain-containing protein
VALRRLRSWLRAFKPALHGTVRRKDRRQLRTIAAATNLGRDTDVQLTWLRQASRGLRRQPKRGADWLARYLTEQQASDPLEAALFKEFRKVRKRLGERLSTKKFETASNGASITLASAIAKELVAHAEALRAALRRVRSPGNEPAAHKARIAAKRVRYLLEPAVPYAKHGSSLLKRLELLQDELGTLHDAHVMRHQLGNALEALTSAEADCLAPDKLAHRLKKGRGKGSIRESNGKATAPSSASGNGEVEPRGGVLVLADRLNDDTQIAFDRVQQQYRDGGAQFAKLGRDVATFAKRLKRRKVRR